MKKAGRFLGGFLIAAMYLIQIYGYYVLYGPIAAIIAFVVPISLLGYPFFFHAARGFWPTGWIIWFVVGFILFMVTDEKGETEYDDKNTENLEGFCPKCGTPRKKGNLFCPKCGLKFGG